MSEYDEEEYDEEDYGDEEEQEYDEEEYGDEEEEEYDEAEDDGEYEEEYDEEEQEYGDEYEDEYEEEYEDEYDEIGKVDKDESDEEDRYFHQTMNSSNNEFAAIFAGFAMIIIIIDLVYDNLFYLHRVTDRGFVVEYIGYKTNTTKHLDKGHGFPIDDPVYDTITSSNTGDFTSRGMAWLFLTVVAVFCAIGSVIGAFMDNSRFHLIENAVNNKILTVLSVTGVSCLILAFLICLVQANSSGYAIGGSPLIGLLSAIVWIISASYLTYYNYCGGAKKLDEEQWITPKKKGKVHHYDDAYEDEEDEEEYEEDYGNAGDEYESEYETAQGGDAGDEYYEEDEYEEEY